MGFSFIVHQYYTNVLLRSQMHVAFHYPESCNHVVYTNDDPIRTGILRDIKPCSLPVELHLCPCVEICVLVETNTEWRLKRAVGTKVKG